MTKTILEQMQALIDKYKGKPKPPFMSKEYINRRFDRLKYLKLKKELNMETARKREDPVEIAEELFGTEAK